MKKIIRLTIYIADEWHTFKRAQWQFIWTYIWRIFHVRTGKVQINVLFIQKKGDIPLPPFFRLSELPLLWHSPLHAVQLVLRQAIYWHTTGIKPLQMDSSRNRFMYNQHIWYIYIRYWERKSAADPSKFQRGVWERKKSGRRGGGVNIFFIHMIYCACMDIIIKQKHENKLQYRFFFFLPCLLFRFVE